MSDGMLRILRLANKLDQHMLRLGQPRVRVVEWPWVEVQIAAELPMSAIALRLCGHRIREETAEMTRG